MQQEVFQAWDYVVVAAMLTVSGVIGVFFRFSGGKQRTTSEYLMAGRNMAVLPVTLSLMATVQTAVGTLGFPGEIYLYGTQLFIYPLGFTIALIICTFIYTPVYFDIQITSAYEYLERRFGKVTRTFISSLFIIQMILFMSVGLYSPSIALSAVSGLSHFVSILSVGCVCAFYCTLGGMKAVLWTDVFQSILMFLALLSVILKGSFDVGGFQNMISIAKEGQRFQFFNFTLDPTVRFTFWSSLVGGFMYGMTTCAANQTQVQRMLTLSSLRKSQIALLASIPLNLLLYYTTYMCGVVIYSNYAGCDPLLRTETSGIRSPDQLIPYFMVNAFSATPGMAGFCVSGVFCAALTSISSAVNSLAAITAEDFVKPFCNRKSCLTDATQARLSKCFALFYSALCIGITYLLGNVKSIIPAAFVVFTAIGGPTLAIITLGMVTATANQKGILVGLVLGIILNAWIGAGAISSGFQAATLPQSVDSCPAYETVLNLTESATKELVNSTLHYVTVTSSQEQSIVLKNQEIFPLYKLTFLLQPVPGTLLTLLIGYVVSFITGGQKSVDPALLTPAVRKWLESRADVSTSKQEADHAPPENNNQIDLFKKKAEDIESKPDGTSDVVEESRL